VLVKNANGLTNEGMADVIDSSRDLVNEWLNELSGGVPEEEDFLDEQGTALITREDGESLIVRLDDEMLGFYVMLFAVPEEKVNEFFKVALIFNMHPALVGTGHLSYDEGTNALTYCAQMSMELMNEELFGRVVSNVFFISENLRDQFFTMAGVPSREEPEAVR
jgi:Tir chaperone protein (CesT) family